MKRLVIKTKTVEGESITETERIEEVSVSGLFEAWGYLVLIMFTFLLFIATYRVVSLINHSQDNNYGFQTGQKK